MSVIVADGIWKSYPRWRPGTRSVRSTISPVLRRARRAERVRWALRDVSFAVEAGGALGVIGHNGAGKSTLLRLASGLSRPTRGSLRVVPETASVLSLGATFNGDLSGEANAITAAVIGGMTPAQARAALPQAIEFAGLEGFEDAPVRSYSDGMKLRLAFGVVTLTTPELLILDEVLAVGDLSFQQKCIDHLASLREHGTAIVLASHDLTQIAEGCDHALLLDHGQMMAFGDPTEVIEQYELAVQHETIRLTPEAVQDDGDLVLGQNRFGSQAVQIAGVSAGSPGHPGKVSFGERLEVEVRIAPSTRSERLTVSVTIERMDDEVKCLDLNSDLDEVALQASALGATLTLTMDSLELRPGRYWVDVGVFPVDWSHAYDYHHHAYPLTVSGITDDGGAVYRPQNRRWAVAGPS